jgi:hypothetical protein
LGSQPPLLFGLFPKFDRFIKASLTQKCDNPMENKHLMHSQAFENGIIKCSVMHSQAFENGIIKCSIKINNAFSAYIIITKLSNYITETTIVAYIMLKENR